MMDRLVESYPLEEVSSFFRHAYAFLSHSVPFLTYLRKLPFKVNRLGRFYGSTEATHEPRSVPTLLEYDYLQTFESEYIGRQSRLPPSYRQADLLEIAFFHQYPVALERALSLGKPELSNLNYLYRGERTVRRLFFLLNKVGIEINEEFFETASSSDFRWALAHGHHPSASFWLSRLSRSKDFPRLNLFLLFGPLSSLSETEELQLSEIFAQKGEKEFQRAHSLFTEAGHGALADRCFQNFETRRKKPTREVRAESDVRGAANWADEDSGDDAEWW